MDPSKPTDVTADLRAELADLTAEHTAVGRGADTTETFKRLSELSERAAVVEAAIAAHLRQVEVRDAGTFGTGN